MFKKKTNTQIQSTPAKVPLKVSPQCKKKTRPLPLSAYHKTAEWQLEGCQELLKKLSREEQDFYLATLQSLYDSNQQDDFVIPSETIKEQRARHYANRSDVMTVVSKSYVELNDYENGNYLEKIAMPNNPSAIQMREKHHIDLCSPNESSIEDAMIDILDSVHHPEEAKKTKAELLAERKARISKRKNTNR